MPGVPRACLLVASPDHPHTGIPWGWASHPPGLAWEGCALPRNLLGGSELWQRHRRAAARGGLILCRVGWTSGLPGAKYVTFPTCFQRKVLASILTLALREKLWIWMVDLGKLRPGVGAGGACGFTKVTYQVLNNWPPRHCLDWMLSGGAGAEFAL